ncbi:MAG: hypothetical protein E7812_07255 [Phenylobacterium sp.]|nr:MAG: hypothetical protein E7812_07255 [Phenylobacterium sp.]
MRRSSPPPTPRPPRPSRRRPRPNRRPTPRRKADLMVISKATGHLLTGLTIAAALAGAAAAQPAPPTPAPRWPGCGAPLDRSGQDPMLPFGCATEANLRAMIADLRDLDRGVTPTPAQGDAAIAAAARYRLGVVKPLGSDGHAQQPLLVEGKIDTGK